jgi:hypothetical protein
MDVTAEKNAVEQLDHVDATTLAQVSDVSQLVEQDAVPWYQKKNLRHLYLTLVPAALGVEMTSGYDGSVLNGLQTLKEWVNCKLLSILDVTDVNIQYMLILALDFDNPQGAILGIITAAFSLGAVGAIPAVPWFNDRFGRKASIKLGSVFILIGVIVQTASVNSEFWEMDMP